MVKDKTATTERPKKASAKGKKAAKGWASRSALPSGWIQGDWIPSTVTEEDLVNLSTEA